jgi:hypothetical protein
MRAVSARGGWPVRGSDSSRCSLAAGGRALTQAAIAATVSSSSGTALGVADGHPPARRAGDSPGAGGDRRCGGARRCRPPGGWWPRRGAARRSRADARGRSRACPGGCGGRASAAVARFRRDRGPVATSATRATRAERMVRTAWSAPIALASPRGADRCLATVAGERPACSRPSRSARTAAGVGSAATALGPRKPAKLR